MRDVTAKRRQIANLDRTYLGGTLRQGGIAAPNLIGHFNILHLRHRTDGYTAAITCDTREAGNFLQADDRLRRFGPCLHTDNQVCPTGEELCMFCRKQARCLRKRGGFKKLKTFHI